MSRAVYDAINSFFEGVDVDMFEDTTEIRWTELELKAREAISCPECGPRTEEDGHVLGVGRY